MRDSMPLVRDVLDKQIYDVNDVRVGKVDGIVLQVRRGRPPRVVAIESDMPTAWRRFSRRIGDWVERVQRWLSPDLVGATRIDFDRLVRSGIDVEVSIDARRTNAFVWETWLKERFVERLPGGKGHGEKGE